MSKLNHTPGPWSPAKFYGPGEVRRVVGPNNEQIASFYETPDAILAAAAPELLAMAKHALADLDLASRVIGGENFIQTRRELTQVIAKAEGEKK